MGNRVLVRSDKRPGSIRKGVREAAEYYTDHMEPLLTLRYRLYSGDFEHACPDDEAKAAAFQICAMSKDEALQDIQLQGDDQQIAREERIHALRIRALQNELACSEYVAESIIHIYELTDAAQRMEKGFHHTPKANRSASCMEGSVAYQDMYGELMDHSGIQEHYAQEAPGLTEGSKDLPQDERALCDSDAVVSRIMDDFMLDMVARSRAHTRFPSWRKQHTAALHAFEIQMEPHNNDFVSSYPVYDYMGYLDTLLEHAGIDGDAGETMRDQAIRAISIIIQEHKQSGLPIRVDEFWAGLKEQGVDNIFRGDDDQNLRVLASLTVMAQTLRFMSDYSRHALTQQLAPPREQVNAAKQKARIVGEFSAIIKNATENLGMPEPLESAQAAADIWCKHADATAALVAKLYALTPARG